MEQIISNREHDLMVALRQLCDAIDKQRAMNRGKESILVSVKRGNARRILEKYESKYSNVDKKGN